MFITRPHSFARESAASFEAAAEVSFLHYSLGYLLKLYTTALESRFGLEMLAWRKRIFSVGVEIESSVRHLAGTPEERVPPQER
jgi:hypothetical protein